MNSAGVRNRSLVVPREKIPLSLATRGVHCRDVEKSATCNALQVVRFRSDQGAGERRCRKESRRKKSEAPMLRNSDTATSRSRRLHIGKDTEGNIYRRRGRRAKRINISAPGRRAAEASCRGRSLPLSTRLRLTLRRVVSESIALPRTTSSLVERRRTRAGRAASSPGRASSGGCGRVAANGRRSLPGGRLPYRQRNSL